MGQVQQGLSRKGIRKIVDWIERETHGK